MKDPIVPTLVAQDEAASINITIPSTQAQINNQGVTYNQSGYTYDQVGIAYGGIYNQNDDVVPLLEMAQFEQPSLNILADSLFLNLTITQTDALFYDQGYSYNQAGLSYDALSTAYAGVYNVNQDVEPMTLSFEDIYTSQSVVSNNQSIGPGFFMWITH